MKSILLSRQPQIVANILNEKPKEIVCKRFSKGYVGWVYLCCTKGTSKTQLIDNRNINNKFELCWCLKQDREQLKKYIVNSKVVARFWCNYVNKCRIRHRSWEGKVIEEYIEYVVYISKLEVFDRPRNLCEFKTPKQYEMYQQELKEAYEKDAELWEKYDGDFPEDVCANGVELTELSEGCYGLQKPPSNYCYIESEK